MNTRTIVYRAVLLGCILIPIAAISYKLFWLDFPISGLIPTVSYQIDVSMQVDGNGSDITASTYLPVSDSRQIIQNESNNSGIFSLSLLSEGLNRRAQWSAANVENRHSIRYTYNVRARHVRYEIPHDLKIPSSYPNELQKYLVEESGVQVNDPLIEKKIQELFPHGKQTIFDTVYTLHRHLQDDFKNKNFSGFTDALTALKLGEASCNGKGRLFVALARKLNLPARLVGGFVMEPGMKKTSHQWVEIYINGYWAPFDTINNHFAELPAHFLTLYYGDKALFKHSSNVNFQYFFKTLKRLVPQENAQEKLDNTPLNLANIYSIFERIGISQNLLKIILMIPFGALVTVIFRNVIGLETFGTFLPALIASASREAGLFWGMIGFVIIILTASWIRKFLDWIHLLHSPKMAIMLTMVVTMLLLMTVGGVHAGLFELAHVSLFPIAILAITAERFSILEAEQGWRKVSKITLSTILVIAACYVVMDSLFLQSLVLAFPEVLLILVALNLWLGKWVGMRFSELFRFRKLIFKKEVQA